LGDVGDGRKAAGDDSSVWPGQFADAGTPAEIKGGTAVLPPPESRQVADYGPPSPPPDDSQYFSSEEESYITVTTATTYSEMVRDQFGGGMEP
jgi:hypothetical protein